jgi:hypothetical protein
MANVKISALPAATAATGVDVVPLVQSGVTKKLSMTALLTSPTLFGSGMSTFLATPSSDNLRAALTDETGTGSAVFATSPTLTTPTVTGPTVSTGNLTFSGTAQRITGDFSNATHANRLSFQTSTTNGATSPFLLPNGTGNTAQWVIASASDPTNSSYLGVGIITAASARITSDIIGTGTYLPMTFYTGGSERVRVDTSGNVGIGTASPSGNLQVSAANTRVRFSNTAGTASTLLFGADSGQVFLGAETNAPVYFITNNTERMRIDASGNVGIGTASPSQLVEASLSQNGKTQVKVTNVNAGANTSAGVLFGTSSGDNGYIGANGGAASSALGGANAVQVTNLTANPLVLATNNTERMRIDASGNVNISTLGARITGDFTNATVANRLTFQTSTANSTTSVGAIPSGTGTTANFAVVNNSTPTNASVGLFQATSTVIAITTSATGSGTTLPITFNVPGEVARIDTSGNVIQGTAAVATTATAGFLWITSCAGVPTGAPTAPYTNAAAMVCDTTNNRLYVRVAGTWRYATLT